MLADFWYYWNSNWSWLSSRKFREGHLRYGGDAWLGSLVWFIDILTSLRTATGRPD